MPEPRERPRVTVYRTDARRRPKERACMPPQDVHPAGRGNLVPVIARCCNRSDMCLAQTVSKRLRPTAICKQMM